jgi:hypothetical protein
LLEALIKFLVCSIDVVGAADCPKAVVFLFKKLCKNSFKFIPIPFDVGHLLRGAVHKGVSSGPFSRTQTGDVQDVQDHIAIIFRLDQHHVSVLVFVGILEHDAPPLLPCEVLVAGSEGRLFVQVGILEPIGQKYLVHVHSGLVSWEREKKP